MRIIPLRGPGVAWYKCPACRLKCRPNAIGADGVCPRCGYSHMMRLSFTVGRTTASAPPSDRN